MDNQHRAISGYRELGQDEIDLMNELKGKAAEVGAILERMREQPELDQRAVEIARTKAQEAFMWAVRAVARPTTFG